MEPTLESLQLVYVHDPMCSWCYGFGQTHDIIVNEISTRIPVRRLLGGLAPDTEEPMPMAMQSKLQQVWQQIEQVIPGTQFNYDFWKNCQPRRATYPACRAVIAARCQGEHFDPIMSNAIQQAYYRHARNPSDHNTLVSLADEINLDANQFDTDLRSEQVHQQLLDEIHAARTIGINSYPSIAVVSGTCVRHIDLAYTDPVLMIEQIDTAMTKLRS
ncbi:MAG: DsbA family protein [Halioglobus sp.]